jgi:hypothetical protein
MSVEFESFRSLRSRDTCPREFTLQGEGEGREDEGRGFEGRGDERKGDMMEGEMKGREI